MRRLLHRRKEKRCDRSAATRNLPETMVPGRYAIHEARQQNTLSAAERRQWFDVFLPGSWTIGSWRCNHRGSSPSSVIYYLRDRAGLSWRKSTLQRYLIENTPLFTTDAQEKSGSICYLNTAATPFRSWRIIRTVCRQPPVCCWRDATGAVKKGQYDAAQKLLATLPANEMLRSVIPLA